MTLNKQLSLESQIGFLVWMLPALRRLRIVPPKDPGMLRLDATFLMVACIPMVAGAHGAS